MSTIILLIAALLVGTVFGASVARIIYAKRKSEDDTAEVHHARDPYSFSADEMQQWAKEEREELAIEMLDYFGCWYFILLNDGTGKLRTLDTKVPLMDQYPAMTQSPALEDARNMWMYLHPTERKSALEVWRLKQISRGKPLIDLDHFMWSLEISDWFKRATKKKPYPPRIGRIAGFTSL